MRHSHKKDIVDQAIIGLEQGGFDYAEIFRTLLERVYDCGYNECLRNLRETDSNRYSDVVSDGGMDPRN